MNALKTGPRNQSLDRHTFRAPANFQLPASVGMLNCETMQRQSPLSLL